MAMYFQHNLSDDEFLSKLEAIDPALAKRVEQYGINQWVKSEEACYADWEQERGRAQEQIVDLEAKLKAAEDQLEDEAVPA
jgi:hypothetical protein